jgi:hypothetical protein
MTPTDTNNVEFNKDVSQTGYTTATTVTNNVISLPNSQKGIIEATLKGRTAVNSVINGNFANGTNGWIVKYGTGNTANNELIYTITELISTARIEQSYDIAVAGHKYYVRGEIYPKYGNTLRIQIGNVFATAVTTVANAWNFTSTFIIAADTIRFRFYHDTSSNYAIGDTFKYRNIIAVDLTALYGAGNEPTQAQCDSTFQGYWDGAYSVPTSRVRSIGKNLFNLNNLVPSNSNTVVSSDTITITSTNNYFNNASGFFILIPFLISSKNELYFYSCSNLLTQLTTVTEAYSVSKNIFYSV